jgi:hypothetical protein
MIGVQSKSEFCLDRCSMDLQLHFDREMRLSRTGGRVVFVPLICLLLLLLMIKSIHILCSNVSSKPSLNVREELIEERMKSHSHVYERKEIGCLAHQTLNEVEKNNFDQICESLIQMTKEMVSHPRSRQKTLSSTRREINDRIAAFEHHFESLMFAENIGETKDSFGILFVLIFALSNVIRLRI